MRLLFLLLFTSTILFSHEITLDGYFAPGEIIFGKAEKAKSIYLNDYELLFDNNGFFVFGFDRNEKGTYYLKIKFESGKVAVKKIELAQKNWDIQQINSPIKQFGSKIAVSDSINISAQRKIKKQINQQFGSIIYPFYQSGFKRPVKSKRKTGVFGSQRILNGVPRNIHNGTDYGVPKGTPVFAMADGLVRLTADNFYYSGNYVHIDHGQGLHSRYLHLSKILVDENQIVKKGDVIGEVGSTGRSTAAHLHWTVQWFNKRIDPLSLLNIKIFE